MMKLVYDCLKYLLPSVPALPPVTSNGERYALIDADDELCLTTYSFTASLGPDVDGDGVKETDTDDGGKICFVRFAVDQCCEVFRIFSCNYIHGSFRYTGRGIPDRNSDINLHSPSELRKPSMIF